MGEKTLKDKLARFMDPEAFKDSVPAAIKHTCAEMGKVRHDKLKVRREIAKKRADAAIRFFLKPGNRALLDARTKATQP